MPAIHFSDLVAMTAGELLQVPVSYEVEPDALQALIAESNLPEVPSAFPLPRLILDEIEIDVPVHFHISVNQVDAQSSLQLTTTLPSPLVPKSAIGLNHFRMTLRLNSTSN